jgi:predicted transcriptional regulator
VAEGIAEADRGELVDFTEELIEQIMSEEATTIDDLR